MIAVLAGTVLAAVLLVGLALIGERGGWPLYCSPEDAARARQRPPWDVPAGFVRGCHRPEPRGAPARSQGRGGGS